jgi:hypothetical protein
MTLAALVFVVVGQEDGGLLVAEVLDGHLTEFAASDAHLGVVHLRETKLAGRHVELDLAPRRGWHQRDLASERGRTCPQGHERDPHLVEPHEIGLRRELRIEHQVAG